jgi:hypothetical protein
LALSAHVEVEHAMELLAGGHSIGYLLKSRVTDVADFIDTLGRIAKRASVRRGMQRFKMLGCADLVRRVSTEVACSGPY